MIALLKYTISVNVLLKEYKMHVIKYHLLVHIIKYHLLVHIIKYHLKRCLLLGRRATTNLDSPLKSRDITLPTKVHLVKATVFPVVMYGYESWTIKKAES